MKILAHVLCIALLLIAGLAVGTAAAQSTMVIPFAPTKISADCTTAVFAPGKLNLKATVNKTKKNVFLTVGTMFYEETLGAPGLGVDYTNAKLAVECRGTGTIRVVEDCDSSLVLATIVCTPGGLPWTATSAAFLIENGRSLAIQVQAAPDSLLEWSNPRLIVY